MKEFSLCVVSENVTIFKQGEIGSYFYIIKEGKVDLFINDKMIKSLTNGDSFGELALLHGASRSGSIKTSKTTTMWVLPRAKFRSVIDHINNQNFEENKKFLLSVPLLGDQCI
jgi:CRP-like cAMP-binding protein